MEFTARKDLTFSPKTKIVHKWVSPEGDFEIVMVKWEDYYSVTSFIVEVPEEGEEIPEGEELVNSLSVIRTKDLERAKEYFLAQLPPMATKEFSFPDR